MTNVRGMGMLATVLCCLSMASCLSRATRDVNALHPVYPTSFLKRDGGSHGHSSGPSASYNVPDDGYAQPSPSASYGAPSQGYSSPASSYGAPASYNEPSDGYAAGDSSYQAPGASYGAPSYANNEDGFGIDLISLIIPALAILGLSLLFPTVVSLSSTRKRRSADQDLTGRVMAQEITRSCNISFCCTH